MDNYYSNTSYGGQGKQHRPGQNHSKGELLYSAKVLSDAAQSVYNHEPGKMDKAKVATAASNVLDAAGVDDSKGFGMYVDKAAVYLNKHDSSYGGKTGHSGGGFGGSGGYGNKVKVAEHSESGYGRYDSGYNRNNTESGYGGGRYGASVDAVNYTVSRYGGGECYGDNGCYVNTYESGYGGGRSDGGYGNNNKSGYGVRRSGYGGGDNRYESGYGDGVRSSGGYEERNYSGGSYGYRGNSGGGYGDERSGRGYGRDGGGDSRSGGGYGYVY
ncbi:uncharacterized protein LOC131646533 [Vicia villosa]|uniref:uncharacterized protein LOC131646533 n=1 Tax=Vicia villosa TaxID=3911 RepID=UPI00273CB67C|nr:uncharacterized protein LOC131646533 [Vicia villosa]